MDDGVAKVLADHARHVTGLQFHSINEGLKYG